MFGDLAFIDWIALAFAAVLLAGAAAAGVLAYITNRARTGADPATAQQPASASSAPIAMAAAPSVAPDRVEHASAHTPRHAKTDHVTVKERRALVHEAKVKMAAPVVSRATPTPGGNTEQRLAARAARLRGRPLPEPAVDARKRVVSAGGPERTPAHAKTVGFAPEGPLPAETDVQRISRQGFATRTPGFFEDPLGRHELRYWDGTRWTEYVKESGERFTDPL